MKEVLQATSENIEKLTAAGTVFLIFSASWCGPCKAYSRIQDQFVQSTSQPVRLVKVNVDEYPELAAVHGVRNVPTTLFLSEGNEELRKVGLLTIEDLETKANVMCGQLT